MDTGRKFPYAYSIKRYTAPTNRKSSASIKKSDPYLWIKKTPGIKCTHHREFSIWIYVDFLPLDLIISGLKVCTKEVYILLSFLWYSTSSLLNFENSFQKSKPKAKRCSWLIYSELLVFVCYCCCLCLVCGNVDLDL